MGLNAGTILGIEIFVASARGTAQPHDKSPSSHSTMARPSLRTCELHESHPPCIAALLQLQSTETTLTRDLLEEAQQWVLANLHRPCTSVGQALNAILLHDPPGSFTQQIVTTITACKLHRTVHFLDFLLTNQIAVDNLVPQLDLQRNILSPTVPAAVRACSIRLVLRCQQDKVEPVDILETVLRELPGANPWQVELAALEGLVNRVNGSANVYILSRASPRFHKQVRDGATAAVEAWSQAEQEAAAVEVGRKLGKTASEYVVVGLCAVAAMAFEVEGSTFRLLFDRVRSLEEACASWMRPYCEDALEGLGRVGSLQTVRDLVVDEGLENMRLVRALICNGTLCKWKRSQEGADFEGMAEIVEALCDWASHVTGICTSWLDIPEEGDQRKQLEQACREMSRRAGHALHALSAILEDWRDCIVKEKGECRMPKEMCHEIVVAACAWIYTGSLATRGSSSMDSEYRGKEDTLPWSSQDCVAAGVQLLKQLKMFQGRGQDISSSGWYVRHVLCKTEIEILRERLAGGKWRGESWLRMCALLHCVDVMDLSEVEVNESDLLGNLVPILLPLIDDVNGKCNRMGLCALQRILEEVTPTAFRRHGELILNSMETALAAREVDTMGFALYCLLGALNMVEPMLRVQSPCPMHHRFLKKTLTYLKLLQDEGLRFKLLCFIDTVFQRMAINGAAYLQELLPVLEQVVSSGGDANRRVRMEAVKILGTLLKHCWAVCTPYHDQIVAIFLRAHIMASVSLDISPSETPTAAAKSELDLLSNTVELIAGLVSKDTLMEKMNQIESTTGQTHFDLLRSQAY